MVTVYTLVMSLIFASFGAYNYRFRGAGSSAWCPRPFRQALFAVGIAGASAVVFHRTGLDITGLWPVLSVLLVLVLSTAALTTGHASYQDMGQTSALPADGQTDEWYGILIGLNRVEDKYLHDFIGMSVNWLMALLPFVFVVFICYGFVPGVAALFLCLCKPVGYVAGWKVYQYYLTRSAKEWSSDPLRLSELFTGAITYLGIYYVGVG